MAGEVASLEAGSAHQWEVSISLFTTGETDLDFETVTLYSLIIYAKDDQGGTASQTILIQIADVNEPPIFIGSLAQGDQVTEIYILEDITPGTVIYRAFAKDPENEVLEYFLSPAGSGFRIDSTGTISTAASFDFERQARSFLLVVKVVDPGGLFIAGNLRIFLINVNNKTPILTCSLFSIENAVLAVTSVNSTLHHKVNITLDEEIPVGKTIGKCQATDEDHLGDLTFTLDPQNTYFAVDKEHGTVVSTDRLDVERAGFARVQSFSVKACDHDQRCATIAVTAYIHGINDNPPFCDHYLIRYTGKEVIAKDTVVAKLLCHDLDEPPDTIHYAPVSGPIGSGQLFVQMPNAENFIQVAQELDYENPEIVAVGHIYEMTVSVYDDLHPSHTVTVTVIIEIAPANDFSPVFEATHYSFSVPETSGEIGCLLLIQPNFSWINGWCDSSFILQQAKPSMFCGTGTAFYKVGKVTAIDSDYPPNCVKYKIISGDIQVIQRFWVHPLSGMIELITQPDYETVKQYNLTVEGVDCDRFHPRTGLTMVTVDIEDENDEAPACTPSLYKAVIFDNAVAGMNVNGFQLNCHDRDSQDFEMRFEMVFGNENNHFGFDPTRGSNTPKLIVKNPFESGAEQQRRYHLVVHIIDDNLKHGKATKPRTGTVVIDIYVQRANPPPPPTTSSEVKSYRV
ncbi:PREDICTED: cadherin-related family member 3 [Condylura cristata]|uniref:cadherin-related family member 3 n=1 Tax=Condylura cristata TaxID=143302 RepID=UPI0003345FD6|nr:PREDICTED: cadherin-related family member 3 [Condylura cristata]